MKKTAIKESKSMINWEKVVICGVALGWMTSTLYLLLIIAATITK